VTAVFDTISVASAARMCGRVERGDPTGQVAFVASMSTRRERGSLARVVALKRICRGTRQAASLLVPCRDSDRYSSPVWAC